MRWLAIIHTEMEKEIMLSKNDICHLTAKLRLKSEKEENKNKPQQTHWLHAFSRWPAAT